MVAGCVDGVDRGVHVAPQPERLLTCLGPLPQQLVANFLWMQRLSGSVPRLTCSIVFPLSPGSWAAAFVFGPWSARQQPSFLHCIVLVALSACLASPEQVINI